LRPVSLEPASPQVETLKKYSRKVTSGQITEQNIEPLMLIYGKIMFQRMPMDGD
jgi:hypothetical protein